MYVLTEHARSDLRVGGLESYSSCDYPDALCAVIFLQGCSWRCPYCHNADLRPISGGHISPWADVLWFLKRRVGLLDAVVFSGGEPLMQGALPEAMEQVRAMGFSIGLHTGGPSPERFEAVLPFVDWVGFDVKAPFAEYEAITGAPGSGEKARESLHLLIASGKAYELRTTVHPKLLGDAAIARLNADLAAIGVGPTKIQPFRQQGCLAPDLLDTPNTQAAEVRPA